MNGTFTAPNQITLDRSDYALTDIKCIINQRTQATLYTITTPTAVGATLVGNLLTISNSTSQVGDIANIISKPVELVGRWSPTQIVSVLDTPLTVEFGDVVTKSITGAPAPFDIIVGNTDYDCGAFSSALIPELAVFQSLALRDSNGVTHFNFYNVMGATFVQALTSEAQLSGYGFNTDTMVFNPGNLPYHIWRFSPYMMGYQTKTVTITPVGISSVSAVNPRGYNLTGEAGHSWSSGTVTPHFYIDTINPLVLGEFTLTIGSYVYVMNLGQSQTAISKNGVAGTYWTDFGLVAVGLGHPNPYLYRIIIPGDSPLASHFVTAANGTDLYFDGTISITAGTITHKSLVTNTEATYKWEKVPTDELSFVDGVPQFDKADGEFVDADASLVGLPMPLRAGRSAILWSTPPDERTADAVSAPVTTTITGGFSTDDLTNVQYKDFNVNFLGGTLCLQVKNTSTAYTGVDVNIQFSNDGITYGVPQGNAPTNWTFQTLFLGNPSVQSMCLGANWYLSAGQSYFIQLDVSGFKYIRFLGRNGNSMTNFIGGARYDFVVSNAETQAPIPQTQMVNLQQAANIITDGAQSLGQFNLGAEISFPNFYWMPYISNPAYKAKYISISELTIPEGTSVYFYFGGILASGTAILAPCVTGGAYSGHQIDVVTDLTWLAGIGAGNYTGTYNSPMGAANKISLVSGTKYFIDISDSKVPCRFFGLVKTGTGIVTMGGSSFDWGFGSYSNASCVATIYGAN